MGRRGAIISFIIATCSPCRRGRRGGSNYRAEGKEKSEGRIKTNPLCELVLVAMVTIITSHLGEQEQEERRGEKEGGRLVEEEEKGWDGMKTRRQKGCSLWETWKMEKVGA